MFLKDSCPMPPIDPQWRTYYRGEAHSWQRLYLRCIQEFNLLIFHSTIRSQYIVDITED